MATLFCRSSARLSACELHPGQATRTSRRLHDFTAPSASRPTCSTYVPRQKYSSRACGRRSAVERLWSTASLSAAARTTSTRFLDAKSKGVSASCFFSTSYRQGSEQRPKRNPRQSENLHSRSPKADGSAEQHEPSEIINAKGSSQPSKDTSKINHSLENAQGLVAPGSVSKKVQSSLKKLTTTHENIYNLPNFLTITRLIAAPTTAYLLLHDYNKAALALFAYAGITDFVDGWLARRWQLRTVAGSVMDPMADKALMIILTATLAAKGAIPLYLATLILGRDASMGIAAIYYRYASLPAPKTFMRYWDFSLPSAEVHPTQISKQNTFLQLILIGSTLVLPVLTADSHHLGTFHDLGLAWLDPHTVMTGLQLLVATTTVWSGLSYVTNKSAVKMLSSDGDSEQSKLKNKRQGSLGRAIIGLTFGAVIILAAVQAYQSWQAESDDKDDTQIKQS